MLLLRDSDQHRTDKGEDEALSEIRPLPLPSKETRAPGSLTVQSSYAAFRKRRQRSGVRC